MSDERISGLHSVIMENCKKISMTGVREVKTFDDETVVLETDEGLLTVKGDGLNIGNFSAGTGELNMEGRIIALVYSENTKKLGFAKRIFR